MPTREASLLAECAARPDDDAPRRIWADAVGGERGELVALQCGREALPRAELIWRNRRERELLAAHGLAWSGLARYATRVRYHRGFVDAIEVTAETLLGYAAEIFEAAPLLTGLTLTGLAQDDLARIVELEGFERIRALELADRHNELDREDPRLSGDAMVQRLAPILDRFVALAVPAGLSPTGLVVLANATRLERLRLHQVPLHTGDIELLAARMPRLAELDLAANHLDFTALAPVLPNLRSLVMRLVHARGLTRLVDSPLAATLERLVLAASTSDGELDADSIRGLGKFTRLRELELRGVPTDRPWLGELAALSLPALRSLVLGCWASTGIAEVVDHFAPQLELLDLRGTRRLDSLPPTETDILVDEPGEVALLDAHPRPRASWLITPPREHPGPTTRPAWLVCEDGVVPGRVWDLGVLGDDRIRIGRGASGDVVLHNGTVARTHAIVIWHDGAHWIRDMRSTNGTLVDGVMIEHDHPLHDGMRLTLGVVLLRYFTTGAAATACALRVATHEPLTGLPRAARADAAWLRITNLPDLERVHGLIAADRAIEAVGKRLLAAAGDAELSSPQRNVFRVYPRERAGHLAAISAGEIDHEGLTLQIRIEARPIG